MTDANSGSRTAREFSFGPLYDLLMETFPDLRTGQGVFDVRGLASNIERSPEGVYQWLRKNSITLDGAKRLIKLSEDRLEPAQFLPFLFPTT